MTELLDTKIHTTSKLHLSIIKRDDNPFKVYAKKLYIFFTKFRVGRKNNLRYVISRYHLVRQAKKHGIYGDFNFCLSHSGKYSAILLSSDSDQISIDLERVGRKLPESLRLKIRSFYADLQLSELKIIMILESLVKLPASNAKVSLSNYFSDYLPVQIVALTNSVYEVNVNNIKVYSKIYTFADLYICITLKSNRFSLSL